jgi:hypothetical protein
LWRGVPGERFGVEMEALPVDPLPVIMLRLPGRLKATNAAALQE